ncbi:glycosyltransferase family 2 protein [Flavobacterium sp.]|uniref:glycosyltransferase family 2 protein n=1 Tax=Flavobacterium sp. TaxID=239 RepID=UPI0039E69AA5
MRLSVVILAKTDTKALYEMTMRCIRTLQESEAQTDLEIILIESNKTYRESGFGYPAEVKVMVPQEAFNFHRFLNIGIEQSTGDYIALCNNDLVFHDNWFGEIYKVAQQHPDILSFSPSGIYHQGHQPGAFAIGYRVMIHLMGWCFVVKKEIFDRIGPLDETFDFYYADNDYGMTLRYLNIKHAIVYNSYVEHLERKSVPKVSNTQPEQQAFVKNYKIPKYLKHPNYAWVFDSEKYLSGILKYHNKWGSPRFLLRKNKLADLLIRNHLGFLNRFFLKIRF